MARKNPVRVRSVVCLSCTKGLLKKKPVEMEWVETIEAKGLENHLVGVFKCPNCNTIVGFIHEVVKILKDGKVIRKDSEEYRVNK